MDLRKIVTRPAHLLWFVFVFLQPFYLLPSGLPQPSDVLLLILVPIALYRWKGRLHRNLARPLRPLLWFVLWVFLVNYGWALVLSKWTMLKAYTIFPLYYVFNLAIFFALLLLYQRFGRIILRSTVTALFAAVGVQVVVSLASQGHSFRDAVFFNNANQLGYYALLAASMIAMAQKELKISLLKASLGLTGCAHLALISGSRSGVAGIALLFFLIVFSNPRVILAASVVAVALLVVGPVSQSIDHISQRANRKSHYTFAQERGYDRMWKYKEYMIIGAGEGDVNRFSNDPKHHGLEIHSSFATVMFSYGIIGISLFLWFIVRIVRGSSVRLGIMLIPTLTHTAAHQGLRFTMLWVLLAFFVALKHASKTKPAQAAPAALIPRMDPPPGPLGDAEPIPV